MIIQCDSRNSDGDLISCARYRIYDEGVKSRKQNSILECEGNTHVLFVIHLPQQSVGSSSVGFQGDPWVSAHIDDLRHINSDTVTLSEAMNMPISHLFLSPDSKVSHESERESSIAEQPQLEPSDQQLAQPHFQPKPKTLKKSGYYLRLHGCIQAAASRLQDSAKNKERATDRVKLLVELIPRSPAILGRLIKPLTK